MKVASNSFPAYRHYLEPGTKVTFFNKSGKRRSTVVTKVDKTEESCYTIKLAKTKNRIQVPLKALDSPFEAECNDDRCLACEFRRWTEV